MTCQVSAWQRGHPLSWAQRSWGPSIVLSAHSLSFSLSLSSLLPPTLSLSQSSPESPSSSLPLLPSPSVSFAHSVAPYLCATPPPPHLLLLPFPPWTLCYWLELCEEINRDPAPRTSSDAVEEDKGTHPDVPFALLPAPYDTRTHIHRMVIVWAPATRISYEKWEVCKNA